MILCVEIRIDVFFSILMLSAQRFKGYELALICRHQDIVCGRSQRQGLESDKVVISRMSDIHMLTPYSSRGTRALAFAVCSLVFDVTCGATPDRRPIQRGSSPTWLFSHSSFFLAQGWSSPMLPGTPNNLMVTHCVQVRGKELF